MSNRSARFLGVLALLSRPVGTLSGSRDLS